AVGRSTPDTRLNRVVLPAPLGPMTPSISPSATERDTFSMMRAPPIWRETCSMASTGGMDTFSTPPASARDGRGHRVGVDDVEELRREAVALRDERRLEHRLDERVVL